MSENRKSEGRLVTFENCTAVSNIPAGTPVAIANTTTGYGSNIFTLGHDVAAWTASDLCGQSFIGVLDDDVSAGQINITVWTEGVFRFRLASACATANCHPGCPVFAESGQIVDIPAAGTGDIPIGTFVNLRVSAAFGGLTGNMHTGRPYVDVRINPGALRWGSRRAQITASAAPWGIFPKAAGT